MAEENNVYKVSEGKPDGKRPLGRQRHRWDDRIKIDLGEIDWGRGCRVDSVDSGQGPVAGSSKCGD
jgi:hypothetical protein